MCLISARELGKWPFITDSNKLTCSYCDKKFRKTENCIFWNCGIKVVFHRSCARSFANDLLMDVIKLEVMENLGVFTKRENFFNPVPNDLPLKNLDSKPEES